MLFNYVFDQSGFDYKKSFLITSGLSKRKFNYEVINFTQPRRVVI